MKQEEITEREEIEKAHEDNARPDPHVVHSETVRRTETVGDEPPPRRRPLLIILASAVVLVAILAGWLLWRSRQAAASQADESAQVVVSVRVAKAVRQPIAAQVSAPGTVFPREQATVGAKINAQIKQMPLLKNRVVRAGELIATLESRDLQAQRGEASAALQEAQVNERGVTGGTIPQANAQNEKALRDARANVSTARATYVRRLALYERGGISKKDLEASQLAVTTAEDDLRLAEQNIAVRSRTLNVTDRAAAASRVNQAQQHLANLDTQLSYANVRAPITGIVTDQFQYEGEYAAAGAKLVTIADISEVIVKAQFADTVAAELKVGDSAKVMPTDSPGDPMTGRVSLISRATDPLNRSVEVWVNLMNEAGRLRAQGAAQVTVTTKAVNDAVVVPASAVTLDATNANAGTVMVVDDASVAHETKVTTGIRTRDQIEITSGLQGGETVVVEGNYALPDGTKVQPSEGGDQEGGGGEGEQQGGDKGGEP